jgi:hypothetical protein
MKIHRGIPEIIQRWDEINVGIILISTLKPQNILKGSSSKDFSVHEFVLSKIKNKVYVRHISSKEKVAYFGNI